jgi:hypothetical protein
MSVLLGGHLVADLGAPGAFDERARVDHALEDPVHLVEITELAVTRREGDRCVQHRDPRSAGGVHELARVGHHLAVVHHALDRVVQGPAV